MDKMTIESHIECIEQYSDETLRNILVGAQDYGSWNGNTKSHMVLLMIGLYGPELQELAIKTYRGFVEWIKIALDNGLQKLVDYSIQIGIPKTLEELKNHEQMKLIDPYANEKRRLDRIESELIPMAKRYTRSEIETKIYKESDSELVILMHNIMEDSVDIKQAVTKLVKWRESHPEVVTKFKEIFPEIKL